ncbi:unnamed protein product [Chrysoparadoxa australica]
MKRSLGLVTALSCCLLGTHSLLCPTSIPGTTRTMLLHPSVLQELQTIKSEIEERHALQDTAFVIVPSWRQHPRQFDKLCASLGVIGVPVVLLPLSDGLWAYVLRELSINSLRWAAKRKMKDLQVMLACSRVFASVERKMKEARDSSPNSKRLVVLAQDDAAWLMQAMLNKASAEGNSDMNVAGLLAVGDYSRSFPGQVALEAYPPAEDRAAAIHAFTMRVRSDKGGEDMLLDPESLSNPESIRMWLGTMLQ